MFDQQLLTALRVLEIQESLKNGTSAFMMGCPKETFDIFRQHPTLGPWMEKTFPHTLAAIDAYFEEPEEERNMHEDPFRYLTNNEMPVRVMLVSNTDSTITCEFPDWGNGKSRAVVIRNPDGYQPVGAPGTLYTFQNPSSPYIVPVFLGDKAPLYTHDLAIMMTQVTLELLQSEEGVAWSNILAERSKDAQA
ncbi:hypothetical protein pEaSNUABM10_00199 [Erwinia phage pEa_SNUABM_10]|nr:hypothetical protein pEaSNUABM10_00199 [Erwinia phage pEa_SNUABM_10]